MFTREQHEDASGGAAENQSPNAHKLLPWSDIQVTETENGLTPEVCVLCSVGYREYQTNE